MTLRGDARRREWLVIELRWNAHVKILFYLASASRLSRSSASLLSAPFVGNATATLVTQATSRCLGGSLLGPYGNRRAALISMRSGPWPHRPSRATDRVDSGLLLSQSDVVN